jgi:hypothetical protein
MASRRRCQLARRVDNLQRDIVRALRGCYYKVAITSSLGHGFPDIAVSSRLKTMLMEIKTGDNPLTMAEQKFMDNWLGKYVIVNSVEQALREAEDYFTMD